MLTLSGHYGQYINKFSTRLTFVLYGRIQSLEFWLEIESLEFWLEIESVRLELDFD